MEFPFGLQGGWKTGVFNYEKEVEAASYPNIRMFQVKRNTSATLETDIEGKWEYCEPEFAANFSAVAYYFDRELAEKMKCLVGLIHSSYEGTHIKTWMAATVFKGVTTNKT